MKIFPSRSDRENFIFLIGMIVIIIGILALLLAYLSYPTIWNQYRTNSSLWNLDMENLSNHTLIQSNYQILKLWQNYSLLFFLVRITWYIILVMKDMVIVKEDFYWWKFSIYHKWLTIEYFNNSLWIYYLVLNLDIGVNW